MIERREITEGYKRYTELDIAFASRGKILFDLLNLSNIVRLHLVRLKIKNICFWSQTVKNDWVWRKDFARFDTILNISVDIKGDVFFNYYRDSPGLTLSLKVFSPKFFLFNMVVHLFILNYTLEYDKRPIT